MMERIRVCYGAKLLEQEVFLSISEASRILGVSEAALRQWTDEGKIKAFVTPGGHRRYLRANLNKVITAHPKMLGVKDLIAEIEETVELHREIARKALSSSSWYNKLSQESQDHFADMGRRLLSLIVKYISEPSKRGETMHLARQVGHDMGEILATRGLPLADSVEAFLIHREPVVNVATSLLKRRDAFTDRVVDAIPLAINVIDETLVSLVTAHQQYRSVTNSSKEMH
ncbi:helix-turn-helix domain-containing protein [Chloroflexota bacterium]